MAFDMDMHVSNNTITKPSYAIVMKKRTAKSADRVFIVVKKYSIENTMVHGIGFWWDQEIPEFNMELTAHIQMIEEQDFEEVWVPVENIDYVKSLLYVKK
jgi:hypothetical protein